jgi:cytochrome b561
LLIVLLLALILTGTALVYYSPKLIGFPSLKEFTTSEAPAEKVSETIPAKVIPQGHKFRTSRQAAQLSFINQFIRLIFKKTSRTTVLLW